MLVLATQDPQKDSNHQRGKTKKKRKKKKRRKKKDSHDEADDKRRGSNPKEKRIGRG